MAGLEVMGTMAGQPAQTVPDPVISGYERCGLFVAGDASVIRSYSGIAPGCRWLCHAQGTLLSQVEGWPLEPSGQMGDSFHSEEEARAYYLALRNHALGLVPGLVAQDTRQHFSLSSPSGYAESFWLNQQEVLRLLCDQLTDMQAFLGKTDHVSTFSPQARSEPGTPLLVTFSSQSDIHNLAVARGPTGAADHVVIVYSERHLPEPTITGGMTGAQRIARLDQTGITIPTGVLVVMWGRFSGQEVLGFEDQTAPQRSLSERLQGNVAIPLRVDSEASRRLGAAAAYAVKTEPGHYQLACYELSTQLYGSFTCCAISRAGAEPFLPPAASAGPPAASAGQASPWAGAAPAVPVAPLPSPTQAAAAQQGQTAASSPVAPQPSPPQAAAALRPPARGAASAQPPARGAASAGIVRDTAIKMIELAPNQLPQNILSAVQRMAPQASATEVLSTALQILRAAGRDGSPRFDAIDKRAEPLARAYWLSLNDEERRRKGGAEDKYLQGEIQAIYTANHVKVTDVGGFLRGLLRKADRLLR